MRERSKRSKGFIPTLSLCMLLCIALLGLNGIKAYAAENAFVINAGKLAEDGETYNIQVTVENQGADWEGSVRVMVDEEYLSPSAYDTVISLPQGSVKQFVVRVPINSVESTSGTVKVFLVDDKGKKTADKTFKYLLRDEVVALPMGILSDDYDALTYLDMGGMSIYFYHDDFPVKPQSLNNTTLTEDLETLVFLVIDNYSTEILSEEQILAIEQWVNDGGVLLIGTGGYGEEVLKGFEDSFLGVKCEKVFEPGSSKYQLEHADISKVPVSELSDEYGQYYSYATGAMICSYGDGAIGVLPYSFTEIAGMDATFYTGCTQEDFIFYILEDISSYSSSRYSSSIYYAAQENLYIMRRMLRIIGNCNNPLQLGVLKVLIVIYVIFVGPVLYLILRALKKQEWYWVAVPVAALVGVVVVSFAGRGFEVVDTKAYTVTVQNVADNGEKKSYLYCYDAEHKEWALKLTEGYDYAGSLQNQNYNYNSTDELDYYHHIVKEGNTLSLGVKPSSNFEDTYFVAVDSATDTSSMGKISSQGIIEDWSGMSGICGTVTNNTGKDFLYYAVITGDSLYVFENLAAGESRDLANQAAIYTIDQSYNIVNDYLYTCVQDAYYDEDMEKTGILAALGMGIASSYPLEKGDFTMVIGVTQDWDKVIDDQCNEMSYGCLYQIQ